MNARPRGPSLLAGLLLVCATGFAQAQGPDLTPPIGIETRDVFIDADGNVVNPNVEPKGGLTLVEPFLDEDGNVTMDSLTVAEGINFTEVFVDVDGSVTIDSLDAAPGLVFTELRIHPDGSVLTPTVQMPDGLNTRPVVIGPDGSPIENPVIGAPRPRPLQLLEGVGAAPNPFNPSTEIHFRLNAEAKVTVTVYNSRGVRVREIFRGSLPGDLHVFRWKGDDDRGQAVASGSYFFRIVADGEEAAVKGVLVK